MTSTSHTAIMVSLVLLLCLVRSFAQSPTAVADKWPDYVAGEYDVQPNITYSIANNTELKLDLYLLRDRSVPRPSEFLRKNGVLTAEQLVPAVQTANQ